jgi:MoxR-like ATPase
MRQRYYTGQGNTGGETAGEEAETAGGPACALAPRGFGAGVRRMRLQRPEEYIAERGLVDAVNVALLLGQPLLLTGDPGTGKTQLAASLAWELGLGTPLRFETKSTSVARDLFYLYDALGRFQAGQLPGGTADPRAFLTYSALGEAILRTRTEAEVAALLPPGFVFGPPRRSVVLLDEVDKAPRDFPNDLLNEIENLHFRIPELGNARVEADPALQPIVVVTSNSEKDLPDAFLRRCVFYNIPFPERSELIRIVTARLGEHAIGANRFLADALDLFFELRKPSNGLRKRPATAELLGWLLVLHDLLPGSENPLRDRPPLALQTLSSLVKAAEDQEKGTRVVGQWVTSRS